MLSLFPLLFAMIVGLHISEFDELHQKLEPKLENTQVRSGGKLEKQVSGRSRALSTKNQLLLFFIWMRQYPTEYFLAFMFGCSQTTVSFYLATTLDIFYNYCLETGTIKIPSRQQRDKDSVWIRGVRLAVIVDGSEQQILTPMTKFREQSYYSGKQEL